MKAQDSGVRFESVITAVDAHAEGEPGRVITGGVSEVPGTTMFEKMGHLARHADDIRLRMLREPRGYPALCCNILLPPTHPEADAGVVIMEQTEYPPMSGSNTICVATVLLETGILPAEEPITQFTLETPAGLVKIEARVRNGKVERVTFRNVPAFAVHLDAELEVPHLGRITVDVAWGGMFYVIADAAQLGLEPSADNGSELVRVGEMIRHAAHQQLPAVHPENPAISGVSISQISGSPANPGAHRRNAVVVSTGKLDPDNPNSRRGVLDRCPCGTGTCAKMATLWARGELELDQDFVHEGPLGTLFTGRLVETTKVGPYDAVVPTISGQGWITGFARYVLDPTDPFPEGYRIGDIWS
jgi:proline racemase